MRENEAGFTLIEVLIVASIMLITLPFVASAFHRFEDIRQEEYFVQEFKDLLYDTQMSALATGDYATVVINITTHDVTARKGNNALIGQLHYPDSVSFSAGTLGYKIAFTPDGSNQKSGTFFIMTTNHQYKVVMLIGQGRFYLEEA